MLLETFYIRFFMTVKASDTSSSRTMNVSSVRVETISIMLMLFQLSALVIR